jgi:hypothetical protein
MKGKLSGVIINIFPPERYGYLEKQVFWLKEVNNDPSKGLPSQWELELTHDDIEEIRRFKVGDAVVCEVEVKGIYWSSKNGSGKSGVKNVIKCSGITKY